MVTGDQVAGEQAEGAIDGVRVHLGRARGAGEHIRALQNRDQGGGGGGRVESVVELAVRAGLREQPGQPAGEPAEGLPDRPAQFRVGHHVGVLGQAADRAASQGVALEPQVGTDPLGDGAGRGELGLRPGPQFRGTAADRGERQVGLAAKVVVHAALARPGPLLDRLRTGAHVAALPQQFTGALDELFPGVHLLSVRTGRYNRNGELPERPADARVVAVIG